MLEIPPSPRSSFYASFLPPPPGIPDNRENARTARPIAMAPADGTRARRFSRVGPFEPNNGCKCEGAPPPNRFGSWAPACTMSSVWHGSRRCAWGQRSRRAIFVHWQVGVGPAERVFGARMRRTRGHETWRASGRQTRRTRRVWLSFRGRVRFSFRGRHWAAALAGCVKALALASVAHRARTACCMAGLTDPPRPARERCMPRRPV